MRIASVASILSVLALAFTATVVVEAAFFEYVLVQTVNDDTALIVRSTGTAYLIEKGAGCLSLRRYEGKRVVIDSPGMFLGIGSRLIIPDADQQCRILSSKEIEPRRSAGLQSPGTAATEAILGNSTNREAADEFAFFDVQGRAAVYLEPADDLTFYLWSGEPVAYLAADSVYGFNGKHLGWYEDGLVYDHEGDVVVAPTAAFRNFVGATPIRGLKNRKPLKGPEELKPLRPLFGRSWSKTPPRGFFLMGVN